MGFEGWMAQLLDGILGAGISAGVAAFVALAVVKRQHRADQHTAAMLAALQAAEDLTDASHRAFRLAIAPWDEGTKDGPQAQAHLLWSQAVDVKEPALTAFMPTDALTALRVEFQRHRDTAQQMLRLLGQIDADQTASVNLHGLRSEERMAESLEVLALAAVRATDELSEFRRAAFSGTGGR